MLKKVFRAQYTKTGSNISLRPWIKILGVQVKIIMSFLEKSGNFALTWKFQKLWRFLKFIGFNVKDMYVYMCTLNPVRLFVTMWTVAHQASLSMESFQARIMKYVVISYSRESSWPGDWICVSFISCISRWVLYHWCHLGSPKKT